MTGEEIVRSLHYNMANAFIEGWYEKNHERYTEEIENVFYEGAYAAQKYLIDKACEWLRKHSSAGDEVATIQFNSLEEMIESLKKAMEE